MTSSGLTKEERRALLAQIERQSIKSRSPEKMRQRAESALADGNSAQAKRLVDQLEKIAPQLDGLTDLKDRLAEVEERKKREANLRSTEEMLTRYIQQRKKQLAEFALETLVELSPQHPRLEEYRLWIRDLDQEAELQNRIDELLADGRRALAHGDSDAAEEKLDALQELDPDGPAAEQLQEEMERSEAGRAAGQDIERTKQRVEELLAAGEVPGAQQEIEKLADLGVPKITLDFLGKRLEEARRGLEDQEEMASLENEFQTRLRAGNWQSAREIARSFGERFQGSKRGSELLNEVNRLESDERRKASIEQGIEAVEQFLSQGKKTEAELALKVLQGLDVDSERISSLRERIAQL